MTDNIGELFEKLAIANIKLFEVCDQKTRAASMTQEELQEMARKDVALCRERAALKTKINKLLGFDHTEIKSYGDGDIRGA